MIFMVIIGGLGTIEGSLIGALFYFVLSKVFSDYGTWYLIALGVLAVVITLKFPRGIRGFVENRWDARRFPVQRRLHQ